MAASSFTKLPDMLSDPQLVRFELQTASGSVLYKIASAALRDTRAALIFGVQKRLVLASFSAQLFTSISLRFESFWLPRQFGPC